MVMMKDIFADRVWLIENETRDTGQYGKMLVAIIDEIEERE
jgi:hypothetical protein